MFEREEKSITSKFSKSRKNRKGNSHFCLDNIRLVPKSKRSDSRFYLKNNILLKSKRSQITIFIIIAILLVVAIGIFFVFRGSLFHENIPKELEPVYTYYLSCLQGDVANGASLLGQQAGYIEKPAFSPGNVYMPFSNQLGFVGSGVPYWYYVSGNGLVKQQVPSKGDMQLQLNNFLKDNVKNCDFSMFRDQGFEITTGDNVDVSSVINTNDIDLTIKQDLSIHFGNSSWTGSSHNVKVQSSLGKFYDLAKKIYDYEQGNMFLEQQAVDVLRLYAPVDGVEISCSPKIWTMDNVRKDLIVALENNIPEIKLKGSYYTLNQKDNKYFVKDIGENVDTNVNFLYSREWPLRVEAWPSEDEILRADPVGLQEGMGALGFCYVPYHFVYDFGFPVMVQIYSGNELFQFPMVVYLDKNTPRQAPNVEGVPNVVPELCLNKNTKLTVLTYNNKLEPIEADISFKCFDTSCNIGKAIGGSLTDNFPQCVNGYIIAKAEGYETSRQLFSTVEESTATVFLNKKYKLDLELDEGGIKADKALVTFTKNNASITVSYPEQTSVELTEGQYDIKTFIYSNTSINLKGTSNTKCVDIPKAGVLGLFGAKDEKCFNLDIPDQIVDSGVSGGGSQSYYIAESQLENSKKLIINAKRFGLPATAADLQLNYNYVDISKLDISFS